MIQSKKKKRVREREVNKMGMVPKSNRIPSWKRKKERKKDQRKKRRMGERRRKIKVKERSKGRER